MTMVESRPGILPADGSLINPDFIRMLREQRVLHKREAAFYLAQAEKHGAADEALASMIQAAEKIVAILFPAGSEAADAPEATTEDMSGSPSWMEAAMAVVPKAAEPPTYSEPPAANGLDDPVSDDRTGKSGNMWRTRLLGSRA